MPGNLYSSRNPYEESERFALLERRRRDNDMDPLMDNELGELIMAAARYAMTCGIRRGIRFADPEAESMCIEYAVDASRKADTENPHRFVSYIIASVQQNWKRDAATVANRETMLFPVGSGDEIELAASLDGTAEGMGPWEKLRIFTIKKEPTDGQD